MKESVMPVIYKATNTKNGKSYIGFTTNFKKDWKHSKGHKTVFSVTYKEESSIYQNYESHSNK